MLLKFFLTCNKIGAFTLGGGYAMIPIMEREFVDKNRWMDKQEFMDIMVVAQTTPGIFAIDMASHIGYKMKGVWGGIVGAVGIALPSIIAILIIAMFFQQFKDNYWVGKFFAGVRPAVVALIAAPCFKMAKTANINRYNIWIPFVCCALIAAFGISPIYIIIVFAAVINCTVFFIIFQLCTVGVCFHIIRAVGIFNKYELIICAVRHTVNRNSIF